MDYPARWLVFLMTGLFMAVWLGFLIWAKLSGQFEDTEAPKYRMLEEEPKEEEEAHGA